MESKSRLPKSIHVTAWLLLIGLVAALSWWSRTSTNERATTVPAAQQSSEQVITSDDQTATDLLPTDKLTVPAQIDTAFLAYARQSDNGIRIYSSYLKDAPEGSSYIAWASSSQNDYIELCRMQPIGDQQYVCESDSAYRADIRSPRSIFVTLQPSDLTIPGVRYLTPKDTL